jgi:uncharacterized protein (TIGR03437 family)
MTARYTCGALAVAGLFTGASLLYGQPTPLQIVTNAFPFATLGTPYNQQLVIAGGLCVSNGSASSTIDAGALPPGLSVTSPPALRQWFLQGTPSAVGNFSFTLHVYWTHTKETPFQTPSCTEDAIKAITVTVQSTSTPNQTLAVDRPAITTTYHTGTSPPAVDIVQVTSTSGAVAITVQSATDTGVPWLSVTSLGATTPTALSIGYSVGGLTQGTYTGSVTITSTGLPPLIVPVTLQVITDINNQTLAVDRPQIATTYHIGTLPPAQDTVQVTSSAGPAAITVQAVTDSGNPWLSVTPPSSTTPSALSITYSVSGLTQGTYTGHVFVTSGTLPALVILVTLQVIADNIQLQSTQTSLVFSGVLGGPDPPAQSIAVTVVGANRLFQATVSAPPNGKWLTVTPSAALTPATLTVAVTAKDLPAAVYNGALTMTVGGLPNSSLTIPVTFTLQVPAKKPTITAGGVVDAAGFGNAIAPGTWVSVFGTALSATTRAWRDADFVNGRLPTSLDGISVTINGKPAAVALISPTQINVLAADDTATGLVPVVVKNTVGTSDAVLVLMQTAAPALFEFPGAKYAAGVHVDGSYLAGPALVQQGIPGTAAHVGETIVLFGTGFGATQPAISATALVATPLPLAHPEEFSLRIGGLDATVAYAGLISPGLYQFNVVVPQVAAGDQPVVAELRGLLSQSALMITIQP